MNRSVGSKSLKGGSCKQLADVVTELKNVNRTIGQLEEQHVICKRQIKETLKFQKAVRDEFDNVAKIIVGKSFLLRRRHDKCLEEIAAIRCDELKNCEIEELNEIEEELICDRRSLDETQMIAQEAESLMKLKEMKENKILANLYEKRRKIRRSHRAALAKRKKLLKAKSSFEIEKCDLSELRI